MSGPPFASTRSGSLNRRPRNPGRSRGLPGGAEGIRTAMLLMMRLVTASVRERAGCARARELSPSHAADGGRRRGRRQQGRARVPGCATVCERLRTGGVRNGHGFVCRAPKHAVRKSSVNGDPKENSRNHRSARAQGFGLDPAVDWLEIARRSTLDLRTACLGARHTKPSPF